MAKSFLNNFVITNKIILTNAGALVVTQAVTSGLGFVFWWLAARYFTVQAVGFASAAVAAMMLLGNLGIFGFGTLLIGELPRHKGRETSIITTALIVVGTVGMILGLLFAKLAPWISEDLSALTQASPYMLLFAAGVCLTAVALVVDQALIGLLRGDLQFLRNFLFASIKLSALFVVVVLSLTTHGLSIYTAWMIGNLVSILALLGLALSKGVLSKNFKPTGNWLRNYGRSAVSHHALNLTLQAPALILPLIVTAIISVSMNAFFYTAWMIAGFVFVVPTALTTVLYAVGSADPSALPQKIRMTLKFSFLIGTFAIIVMLISANQILTLFGSNYAEGAAWSLRILTIAVFPITIRIHYVTICRIHRQILRAAGWMALGGLLELTFASLGAAYGGLPGLCMGWLLAVFIESIFFMPTVYRALMASDVSEWLNMEEKNVSIAN